MAKLKLSPKRAEYAPHDPEGRPPIRCLLVGGRAEYGNVRALPNKLWNKAGIVVMKHVDAESVNSLPRPDSIDVELIIVLVDIGSHSLSNWAKTVKNEQILFVPSTWSRIEQAIKGVGIDLIPGKHFVRPAKAPPEPTLTAWKKQLSQVAETVTNTDPIPEEAPMPTPDESFREMNVGEKIALMLDCPDIDTDIVLQLLKEKMIKDNIRALEARIDEDQSMHVKAQQVVVTTEVKTFK